MNLNLNSIVNLFRKKKIPIPPTKPVLPKKSVTTPAPIPESVPTTTDIHLNVDSKSRWRYAKDGVTKIPVED